MIQKITVLTILDVRMAFYNMTKKKALVEKSFSQLSFCIVIELKYSYVCFSAETKTFLAFSYNDFSFFYYEHTKFYMVCVPVTQTNCILHQILKLRML